MDQGKKHIGTFVKIKSTLKLYEDEISLFPIPVVYGCRMMRFLEETRVGELRCASDRTCLYMSNIKNISCRDSGALLLFLMLLSRFAVIRHVDLFDS